MEGRREKPKHVEKEKKSAQERKETKQCEDHTTVFAAIDRLASEIKASRDQQQTQDQKANTLEKWGIGGLYLAAAVGIWAILSASSDSSGQRNIMQAQLGQMKGTTAQTNKIIEANSKLADAASKQAAAAEQQAKIAADAATVSRENMIASERAWVGPRNARSANPMVGKDLKVFIDYQNTGREPAIKTIYDVDAFASEINAVAATIKVGDFIGKCKTAWKPTQAQVVFPAGGGLGNGYALNKTIKATEIDQDVIDGNKSLIVDGCFVYESTNIIHFSSFCYYFTAKQTEPGSWNICLTGNDAN